MCVWGGVGEWGGGEGEERMVLIREAPKKYKLTVNDI